MSISSYSELRENTLSILDLKIFTNICKIAVD